MVVESSSPLATTSPGTSLVISKPTGLAVGELMVAILSSYDIGGGVNTGTWDTLSTWTSAVGSNFNNSAALSIQYKVATAGDVAASNFTFSHTTSEYIVGVVLRVSGNNLVDGGLGTTDQKLSTAVSSTAFSEPITPYTPPVAGSLVIMQIGADRTNGGAVSVSGYNATTAGITFVESYDVGSVVATIQTAAAYGIQGTAAELSEYAATFSSSMDNHYGQFVVFNPPVNATGENTLVTTTAESFTQSGTCDTTGANVLSEATTESFAQSGRGEAPTQWSNKAKITSAWTNRNK